MRSSTVHAIPKWHLKAVPRGLGEVLMYLISDKREEVGPEIAPIHILSTMAFSKRNYSQKRSVIKVLWMRNNYVILRRLIFLFG